MRFDIQGWALRLDCPKCEKTCESFKPYKATVENPYPHWLHGDIGSCKCGARLIVHVDDDRARFEDITEDYEAAESALADALAVDARAALDGLDDYTRKMIVPLLDNDGERGLPQREVRALLAAGLVVVTTTRRASKLWKFHRTALGAAVHRLATENGRLTR